MANKFSGKALVIQLTRDNIRIAKMQLGAKAQILCRMKLDTPAGAVEDGVLRNIDALSGSIKNAIGTPEFRNVRRVIFSLCTTRSISEKVNVPAVKGQQLEKALEANMDIYFPVAVSDYQLTRQVLGKGRDERGNDCVVMQLWAIPRSLLEGYYRLAAACGLNVLAIDYCGNSLIRAVGACMVEPKPLKTKKHGETLPENAETDAETAVAEPTIVHLMAETEMLVMTFVRDGHVCMQRSLLCGYDISSALNEAAMVIDYYRSLNEDRDNPMELIICGGLAEDENFAEYVGSLLDISARIQEFDQGPGWCVCVGAAMTELDFGSSILAGKRKKKSADSMWHYAVLIGGSAALLLVCAACFILGLNRDNELTYLQEKEYVLRVKTVEVCEAAQGYRDYELKYREFSSDWDNIFASIRTYNDNLTLILDEIETLLPEKTLVESMDIKAESMVIGFSCTDKEEAAYLIMALRGMRYAELEFVSDLIGTTGKVGRDGVEAAPAEGSGMASRVGLPADELTWDDIAGGNVPDGFDWESWIGNSEGNEGAKKGRIHFSVQLVYNENLIEAGETREVFAGIEKPEMLEVGP